MVCDTMALVGMLELRLGIPVEEHPDNMLSALFKLPNLGTAEQALRLPDKCKPIL